MIIQSPILQTDLFFQPLIEQDTVGAALHGQEMPSIEQVRCKAYAPRLNPLLQTLFPPFFKLTELPAWCEYPIPAEIHELRWYQNEKTRSAVLRPEASWRKMYPVQPPAKIVGVKTAGSCGCAWERGEAKLGDPFHQLQENGATMGLIYDVLIYLVEGVGRQGGGFFVEWHMFPLIPAPDLWLDPDEDGSLSAQGSPQLNSSDGVPEVGIPVDDQGGVCLENKIMLYECHQMECYGSKFIETTGLRVSNSDLDLDHVLDMQYVYI